MMWSPTSDWAIQFRARAALSVMRRTATITPSPSRRTARAGRWRWKMRRRIILCKRAAQIISRVRRRLRVLNFPRKVIGSWTTKRRSHRWIRSSRERRRSICRRTSSPTFWSNRMRWFTPRGNFRRSNSNKILVDKKSLIKNQGRGSSGSLPFC